MNNFVLLVARILLCAIFLVSGAFKFADIPGTAGYIATTGLPMQDVLAWLGAIFEVGGGLAILVGFQTRLVAYAMALFCVALAFLFHANPIAIDGFPDAANAMLTMDNQIMFLKNMAIAGGFLALAVAGAGAWSIDGRRGK
jgi:putative oxidoreductase